MLHSLALIDLLAGPLLVVLGFGGLIFVHELGHFLAAKAVGIKVTQFALGFGSALIAWRQGVGFRVGSTEPEMHRRVAAELRRVNQDIDPDKATPEQVDQALSSLGVGETEYRLNYLPLGGYVKMLGQEDMNPEASSADRRSFNMKPTWARAIVISAGVIMNLVFGILLFIGAFYIGPLLPPAVVGDVVPGTPAAGARPVGQPDAPPGLPPGATIASYDGHPLTDFSDLAVWVALSDPERDARLTLVDHGRTQQYLLRPRRDPGTGLLALGIVPQQSTQIAPDLAEAELPADALAAGVKPGMSLAEAAGQAIGAEQLHQAVRILRQARGAEVPLVFADDQGRRVEVPARAIPSLQTQGDTRHLLGLVPAVRVGAVAPDSPAQRAGIRAGDLLARVGDVLWPPATEVPPIVQAAQGRPLALSVWRDGKVIALPATAPDQRNKLGISLDNAVQTPVVAGLLPETPCAPLALPAGSRILAINGQPVETWGDMQRILVDAAGRGAPGAATAPAAFTVELRYLANLKDASEQRAEVAVPAAAVEGLVKTFWGPPAVFAWFEAVRKPVKASGPIDAVKLGLHKTQTFTLQTYLTLYRMFQGSVPAKGVSGPVGILTAGASIFNNAGWASLLFFFGVISVSLVVLNFLPIPILDGGLMLFLIIEKLKGSPVSTRIQNAANYVGLALIVAVFVLVTYFDVARLVTGH